MNKVKIADIIHFPEKYICCKKCKKINSLNNKKCIGCNSEIKNNVLPLDKENPTYIGLKIMCGDYINEIELYI
jgi:hypothetical protein